MRLVEQTKVCADCKERKPFGEFYPRTYWPDGSVRNVTAYCKPCNIARSRAWDRDNPERLRAKWREATRRRRADPERHAIHLEGCRRRYRERVGTFGDEMRHSANGDTELLPVEPLAAWLLYVMERDGCSGVEIAARFRMANRVFGNIVRSKQRTVTLTTVERALIADDTITLRELYPALYSEAA